MFGPSNPQCWFDAPYFTAVNPKIYQVYSVKLCYITIFTNSGS